MYHLLYFPEDGSLDVCSSDTVCLKKSHHYVRYGTKWFFAQILMTHESKDHLSKFSTQLTANTVISVQREDLISPPPPPSEESLNGTDGYEGNSDSNQDDSPFEAGIREDYVTPEDQTLTVSSLTDILVGKKTTSHLLFDTFDEENYYGSTPNCEPSTEQDNFDVRNPREVRKCLLNEFLECDDSDDEIAKLSTCSSQDPNYIPSESPSSSDCSDEVGELSLEEIECEERIDFQPVSVADHISVDSLNEGEHETTDFQPVSVSGHPNMNADQNAVTADENVTPFDVLSLIDRDLPLKDTVTSVIASSSNVKKFFCVFCKNKYSKLSRHLETVHKDRDEVKKFSCLPKGNPERQKIISLLRGAGNYVYNTNGCFNTGDMMVARRPQSTKERTPDDFMCCPFCRNFFSKISIKRHTKNCVANEKKTNFKNVMLLGRKVCARISNLASEALLKRIFPYMHEDEVSRGLRYDEIAILYGNELCLRYRDEHFDKYIRSQLRLLGRLLLTAKKMNNSITAVKDLFQPKHFNCIMDAVTKLGNINPVTQNMKSPAVALNCGTILRKVAKFYVSYCIKNEDDSSCQLAKKFLWLMDTHFNSHVSQTAFESKLTMTRQKKTQLPPDEDIQKFMLYILDNIKKNFLELSKVFTHSVWRNLASFSLLWTITFNRRRVGEVERLKIEDFNNFQTVDEYSDGDIFRSLSLEAQEATKKFIRVVMRGKLGRTVPVLLCTLVFRSIKLILKHREDANVPKSNPYVFGLPGDDRNRHLIACNLLREHAANCGASQPNLLRGTNLRKHIATRCVLLNLTDRQISDLANYMGHDEKIHKGIYRLPIVTREITEISKLLEKAQGVSVDRVAQDTEDRVEQDSEDRVEPCIDIIDDEQSSQFHFQNYAPDRVEAIMSSNKDDTRTVPQNRMELDTRTGSGVGDEHFHQIEGHATTSTGLSYSDSEPESIPEDLPLPIPEDLPLPSSFPKQRKVPWTSLERSVAREVFRQHLCAGKAPSLKDCFEAVKKHPELSKRSPPALRTWIVNQLSRPITANSGRKRWTSPEKRILKTEFQMNYATGKLPSLHQCDKIIQKYRHVFKHRAPQVLKAKINNDLRKASQH